MNGYSLEPHGGHSAKSTRGHACLGRNATRKNHVWSYARFRVVAPA